MVFEFKKHYAAFEKETMVMSFTVKENEHYKEIIKMGRDVLPMLFKKLETSPNFPVIDMISDITGETVEIPLWMAGKLKIIAAVYLEWGKEMGYVDS